MADAAKYLGDPWMRTKGQGGAVRRDLFFQLPTALHPFTLYGPGKALFLSLFTSHEGVRQIREGTSFPLIGPPVPFSDPRGQRKNAANSASDANFSLSPGSFRHPGLPDRSDHAPKNPSRSTQSPLTSPLVPRQDTSPGDRIDPQELALKIFPESHMSRPCSSSLAPEMPIGTLS